MSDVLENGIYIETKGKLTPPQLGKLRWFVRETFEPKHTRRRSAFPQIRVIEIGPRLSMETPYSSNAVAMCHRVGIRSVIRVERTSRFLVTKETSPETIRTHHLDAMTEQVYPHGIDTFKIDHTPEPVCSVPILEEGKDALQKFGSEHGLNWDSEDIARLYDLYAVTEQRNPTDVELFDDANCNGDHSRHRKWKSHLVIDGNVVPYTLMDIAKMPLQAIEAKSRKNSTSLVAFADNSAVIRGFTTNILRPQHPDRASRIIVERRVVHYTFTGETHNWPTYVSPYGGGATGGGGRRRDGAAVGRGAQPGAAMAGYATDNLFVPGYKIPGEEKGADKPAEYASALNILLKGSDGVCDDANRCGEPIIGGWVQTFGQRINGEWIAYRKPILWSGGVGTIFDDQLRKAMPARGMIIVGLGGPAYNIGFGGGARSSGANTETETDTKRRIDERSVQRANGEMANKSIRPIVACALMGKKNPIASLTDQGAGGPANALKELIAPAGGRINIRKIQVGDVTISVAVIWNAEYQERYALLVYADQFKLFQRICKRECVNCERLGRITGNGRVVVHDPTTNTTPVNMNLERVLGALPQKTWRDNRITTSLPPLQIPSELTVAAAVQMTFARPDVGSKEYLVHKGDRSVGGKVAQQPTQGITQIPIADCGILATGFLDHTGVVESIGTQPIIMLIDPKAGARMAIAEMVTNMAGVRIRGISSIDLKRKHNQDTGVRTQQNWMLPAKAPGQGAWAYDAALAGAEFMIEIGMAQNGGKDSTSLMAQVCGELVKSPSTTVILGCAAVPDIRKIVTCDIKRPGQSLIGLIDLGLGKNRLGGSSFAQALGQIGNDPPDADAALLKNAWLMLQRMIDEGLMLALHDRSNGGLITTVSEMCMAGGRGFRISIKGTDGGFAELFSQELGCAVEFLPENSERIMVLANEFGVPFETFGCTTQEKSCVVKTTDGRTLLDVDSVTLRRWWGRTSFELEKLQRNPACAQAEWENYDSLPYPDTQNWYRTTFTPIATPTHILERGDKPRAAVLREEGTNGDDEMRAILMAAGFAVYDLHMSDLVNGTVASLDSFQTLVFAGGFSFMDVFDSGKGWAGVILFNPKVRAMFERFYSRPDTISFGPCNGCQLMSLLGLVPWRDIPPEKQPRFVQNASKKFESRWTRVEILPSPATEVFFKDMVGCQLGIWVAHGEGRAHFPDPNTCTKTVSMALAPVRYLDPLGNTTERYPYNPNGSPLGIASLCSPDGRHLAMMPHPERCFLPWQWPYLPEDLRSTWKVSPWLRMFQNARDWCMEHRQR